jgi:molybdopterin-guanine dinucleotide biosynthesis protein B
MPPIVSIVGRSGSGKTTLVERLISELKGMGLSVGTIKHDVHGFEIDYPGKDSWRHKQAGSKVTLISSPARIAMVMDVDHDHRIEELAHFLPGVDIILAEGYKREKRAKVEIFREEVHSRPLCMGDGDLIALVTDTTVDLGVPRFKTHDARGLALFLMKYFKVNKK